VRRPVAAWQARARQSASKGLGIGRIGMKTASRFMSRVGKSLPAINRLFIRRCFRRAAGLWVQEAGTMPKWDCWMIPRVNFAISTRGPQGRGPLRIISGISGSRETRDETRGKSTAPACTRAGRAIVHRSRGQNDLLLRPKNREKVLDRTIPAGNLLGNLSHPPGESTKLWRDGTGERVAAA